MELESRLVSLGGKSTGERGSLGKVLLLEKGRKTHGSPDPTSAAGRPSRLVQGNTVPHLAKKAPNSRVISATGQSITNSLSKNQQ